jgi:biotin operon repressor
VTDRSETSSNDGVKRLRDLADFLAHLATELEKNGELDALPLDVAVGQVTAARREIVGTTSQKPGPAAKTRIRRYFEERVGEVVYGEEIAAIAGISEWARRVRELRDEGLAIEELGGSRYRLTTLPET